MRVVMRTMRYWLPIVAAVGCLVAAYSVSPVVAWLLIMLAFGLLFDVATLWFAKAGGTGNLTDHRQ